MSSSSLRSRLGRNRNDNSAAANPADQVESRQKRNAAQVANKNRLWLRDAPVKRGPKAPSAANTAHKSAGTKKSTSAAGKKPTATAPKPSGKKTKNSVAARPASPDVDEEDFEDNGHGSQDDDEEAIQDNGVDSEQDDIQADNPSRPKAKRVEPLPLDSGDEEEEVFVTPNSIRDGSIPVDSDALLSSDYDEIDGDDDEEFTFVSSGRLAKRPVAIESDNDDEISGQPVLKKTRANNFLSERPTIVSSATTTANITTSVTASKQRDAPTITWGSETEYKPIEPGKRLISKGGQNETFSSILEIASNNAIALYLFDCAFPKKDAQPKILLDALVMAAGELKLLSVVTRLQHPTQKDYRKRLQDYIANRVSIMRSDTRMVAATACLASYPLTGRRTDVPKFVDFIRKKGRYIYPQEIPIVDAQPELPAPPAPGATVNATGTADDATNAQGTAQHQPGSEEMAPQTQNDQVPAQSKAGADATPVSQPAGSIATAATSALPSNARLYMDEKTFDNAKPYMNPAIINTLRSLFIGASAPGVMHQELFVSSIDGNDEPEIPMAMLAMVATLVHFCIGEWAEGRPVTKKLDTNAARDEYNTNIKTLKKIAGRPRKYHRLMADLYVLANSSEPAGTQDPDGDVEIDLDGMDE